jgi:hypothetical protein
MKRESRGVAVAWDEDRKFLKIHLNHILFTRTSPCPDNRYVATGNDLCWITGECGVADSMCHPMVCS